MTIPICPYCHKEFIGDHDNDINDHHAYESILEKSLLDLDKDGYCFVKCNTDGRIFAIQLG